MNGWIYYSLPATSFHKFVHKYLFSRKISKILSRINFSQKTFSPASGYFLSGTKDDFGLNSTFHISHPTHLCRRGRFPFFVIFSKLLLFYADMQKGLDFRFRTFAKKGCFGTKLSTFSNKHYILPQNIKYGADRALFKSISLFWHIICWQDGFLAGFAFWSWLTCSNEYSVCRFRNVVMH